MQVQNIQRYIIWGALAAVGYLLLIQWEKDYGGAPKQNQTAIQFEQTEFNQTTNPISKDIDQAAQDLPKLDVVKEEISTQQKSLASSKTIKVVTENLNIIIDLKGGDIVHVELPKHAIDIDNPDQSIRLLQNDSERTYIAQSGLIGKSGPDSQKTGRPNYKSVSEVYSLAPDVKELFVPLIYTQPSGAVITKTFVFRKGSYLVDIIYDINNQGSDLWSGSLFAQIKRDNTIDPYADTSIFAMKPFLGAAYWSEEKKYNKTKLHNLSEENTNLSHKGGWIAFVQHYFISAFIAPNELTNNFQTRINNKQEHLLGFTTENKNINQGERGEFKFSFYAGPKDQNALAKISEGLELTVDYGWLWMIAQILYFLLIKIQSIVINWGWSIVVLTCFIKLLFFPLNQYAFKSMANMRKLQPKMKSLKEKYGDDRQKLSQATMEMYRKEKINPLGSCLPMLIQMPVFIALYWVLSESVEIRHAPFFWWIKDLSIMDPYFVLPGLMAVSMLIQQRLSPMVFQDPMQEKIMKLMPLMFAVFFLFFPAGLVLYWLVNNILTITQQWFINRRLNV